MLIMLNNPVTNMVEHLTQAQFNSYMAMTNGEAASWVVTDKSTDPDLFKYSPDQERDDHGRFGSGSGSSTTSGPGKDITPQMRELFGANTSMDTPPEIQAKMDAINAAEVASGQGKSDAQLTLIAQAQGFDGKPTLVDTLDNIYDLQAKEGGTLVFRGLGNYSATLDGKVDFDYDLKPTDNATFTGQQAAEQFQSGDYHPGWGAFGSGTYTATDAAEAVGYGKMEMPSEGRLGNGVGLAMLIPSDARMPTEEVVKSTMKEITQSSGNSFAGSYNIGRALAAKGYQAYDVGHLQTDKAGYVVVLDRSMLTVSKELMS